MLTTFNVELEKYVDGENTYITRQIECEHIVFHDDVVEFRDEEEQTEAVFLKHNFFGAEREE